MWAELIEVWQTNPVVNKWPPCCCLVTTWLSDRKPDQRKLKKGRMLTFLTCQEVWIHATAKSTIWCQGWCHCKNYSVFLITRWLRQLQASHLHSRQDKVMKAGTSFRKAIAYSGTTKQTFSCALLALSGSYHQSLNSEPDNHPKPNIQFWKWETRLTWLA